MGLARPSAIRERTLGSTLDAQCAEMLAEVETELAQQARADLAPDARTTQETLLFVRLADSDNAIELPLAPPADVAQAFAAAFRQRFGYAPHANLVVDRIRVELTEAGDTPAALPPPAATEETPPETVAAWLAGARHDVPLHQRDALAPGRTVTGPAIIIDALATTVVEPGWNATVEAEGTLRLSSAPRRKSGPSATKNARGSAPSGPRLSPGSTDPATPDPIRLEIFNSLFMAIAEEMGSALQHSASSINIRERLDFSCAIFDGEGRLVANAPHMPVHLGSMGESVRTILRQRTKDGRGLRRGDAYAPAFFVAARGHHADLGGIAPGSMPPDSRSIEDEGILFDNILIVDDGNFLDAKVAAHLVDGAFPARNPALNIADLKAQVAACQRGASALADLSAAHGAATVAAYMAHGQRQAESAVRH